LPELRADTSRSRLSAEADLSMTMLPNHTENHRTMFAFFRSAERAFRSAVATRSTVNSEGENSTCSMPRSSYTRHPRRIGHARHRTSTQKRSLRTSDKLH
jgi:hypothetical protein